MRGVSYQMQRVIDGNADDDEPDHMYRIDISEDGKTGTVTMAKTFDDVTRQGEIEGLTFDESGSEA